MFIVSSHVPISVLLVCIIILGVFKSGCGCSRRLENYSPTVQYYVRNLLWSFNLEFSKSIQRLPKASEDYLHWCSEMEMSLSGNFAKRVEPSKIKFDSILCLSGYGCSRRLENYSPTVQYTTFETYYGLSIWNFQNQYKGFLRLPRLFTVHWCFEMEMSLSWNLEEVSIQVK